MRIEPLGLHLLFKFHTINSIVDYPDRDDVAGAVHNRQPRVHQHLPEELDVALVFKSQRAPLFPFKDLDRFPGSG